MANKQETMLENYDYHLPPELIAQEPLSERDRSRLMLIRRETGAREHRFFYELPWLLKKGDVLVINDTRVIPARLSGCREDTGGKIELLLLEELEATGELERWRAMVKPGKRFNRGIRLRLSPQVAAEQVTAEVEGKDEEGNAIIRFELKGRTLRECLPFMGNMPLPPYIKEQIKDPESYQTVYSSKEGSVAAPTAGFHFTEELFRELEQKGVEIVSLTLHVGPGTFLPVKTRDIREHHMHREYFMLPGQTSRAINRAREEGRRVIAVGTTTCRVLESMAREDGTVVPAEKWTDLFIYPGFRFRVIDGLLTNFHLPRSTLLMLVAAFAGRGLILDAYREAVENKYRFYSFGDATLII